MVANASETVALSNPVQEAGSQEATYCNTGQIQDLDLCLAATLGVVTRGETD